MRPLGPKSFPDLLNIFDEENSIKDGVSPDSKDKWPRSRFSEANSQFGEWNEVELSHTELLAVKLFWNKEFGIPQEGMTVAETLQLDAVQSWIARGKNEVFPESHIWLASEPLKGSTAIEYGLLKNYEGHLIPLDGLHRLLAWADFGKQTTLAFVAGKLRTMKSAESFVDEAIPHESGHIVVGMTVGLPIRGLTVNIVVSAEGNKIGDFATKSVEPPDEEIPVIPASVLHAYKTFLGGGLAGNNFAGITATEECLQNDRVKLSRVGTESLEAMSKEAAKIIESKRSEFCRLTSLIRERFLSLMASPVLKTGQHTLVGERELGEIFSKS